MNTVQWNMSDDFGKRRFPRAAARLRVFYSKPGNLIETSTYATDIGGNGIAFFTDETFEIGDKLLVDIRLKGTNQNVKGLGKVVRCKRCIESDFNLTAIEFTDIDLTEKVKMLDYSLEVYVDNIDSETNN